jgi:hypothetical protein
MRDLFGYRWAFRCTTDSSSDTVLGQGWAADGYTAAEIEPLARGGVDSLLSETGIPRRIKAAYLEDHHIKYLAAYAADLRGRARMTHLHAVNGRDTTSHQGRSAGKNTVKNPLTPKRAIRVRGNDEYAAFARRILRAYARRIADGDVEALILMTGLADEIDTAISQAVTGLRGFGYSSAEIGSRLGVTRQADDPGGLPAEDAPGDHGPCQHHHDSRPVRPPVPRRDGPLRRPPGRGRHGQRRGQNAARRHR